MQRRWSFTRAFFLFYAGAFWLAVQAYGLIQNPAGRTATGMLWLAFPLACIYVGARYNHLVAEAPRVIYYLLYVAIAAAAVGVAVGFVKGPPQISGGGPQPPSVLYYGMLLVSGLLAAVVCLALLRSVRRHAQVASGPSRSEQGSA